MSASPSTIDKAQQETVRNRTSRKMDRAVKIILGFSAAVLILNVMWRAWCTYGRDIMDGILWDVGFKPYISPDLSEEELLAQQASYEASLMRPLSSFFPTPAWGFVDGDEMDTACANDPCKRALIYPEFTQVTCWPSVGGFWTTNLGPVDLDFLGLSRLHDTPRSKNKTEEDEFCARLRQFDPVWYEDELWYRYSVLGITSELPCEKPDVPTRCPPPTPQKPPAFYAYPSTGGIWALKLANDTDLRKRGMGQLKNVFTMEEKSIMIEALGGKFYRDPDTYWALQEQQTLIWHVPDLLEKYRVFLR